MRRSGALAVDDRRRRARLSPFLLAQRHAESVVDPLQRPVPRPQLEIAVHRALRREILRQVSPRTPRFQHGQQPVDHLTHVHRALPAALLRRRDHRCDQCPFRVRQIARIPQTLPLVALAVRRRPHLVPPSPQLAPDIESQPIPPTQHLSGRALKCVIFCSLMGITQDLVRPRRESGTRVLRQDEGFDRDGGPLHGAETRP